MIPSVASDQNIDPKFACSNPFLANTTANTPARKLIDDAFIRSDRINESLSEGPQTNRKNHKVGNVRIDYKQYKHNGQTRSYKQNILHIS